MTWSTILSTNPHIIYHSIKYFNEKIEKDSSEIKGGEEDDRER